jgi:hypothetical protein
VIVNGCSTPVGFVALGPISAWYAIQVFCEASGVAKVKLTGRVG